MIGKIRHIDSAQRRRPDPGSATTFGQGCGILRHTIPPGTYRHSRYPPPAELADWVEHFWLEEWQFVGAPAQTREVLPHPCVHLVFAPGRSRIFGVQLGRFVRELKGRDRIFGIKFHPGAFYPFLRTPVSSIADTTIPATQVFANATQTERELLACNDDQGMVETAARFLAAHRPPMDPQADTARRVVEEIVNDHGITRVEHLVARFEIQERTLQRLFDRYIGASPRWVIKRYRVHEALERMTTGLPTDWATLAQDLGYFDQAHFINDFRKLVGCSPAEYAKV